MKKYIRVIIYLVLFVLLIGAFIYLGKKDFNIDKNMTDAKKFSMEYSIDENNPFKYVYSSEVVDILKNKTGIIYMGFSSNDWSKYYVKYLYEVLKENDIKNVYYYDLLKDRAKYTKNYQIIEEILTDYLYELDNGNIHISTPALIFVKNGKVIYYDDETAIERNNISPNDYWNQERVYLFKSKINNYLRGVNFNE